MILVTMTRALILCLMMLGAAGPVLAQPEPSRPPRPLTFSLSGGILADAGGFIDEVGTRAILIPRFWVRPARGFTLGFEATIMNDPAAAGNRVTVWPGLLANFGGGGGTGMGLGLVFPILDSEVLTPRLKLFFGLRPGPVVIHLYVMQRIGGPSLHSVFGLDVGVGF